MNVAILVSGHGRGTNAQALMDAASASGCAFRIAVVVSATPGHGALARAERAGVPGVVVDAKTLGSREAFEAGALEVLDRFGVEAVALAGFMRKLSADFVSRFHERILNVHPALLPAFGGQGMYGERVHKAVIEAGVKVSGCTVHFADEHYDHGPIILQRVVPVLDDDTPETLAARILPEEHRAYVEALTLLATGRLRVLGRRVLRLPPGVAVFSGRWGAGTSESDTGFLNLCYEIRRTVFCEEQKVPEDLEMDEHDAAALHFLVFRDGRPVATARLLEKDGAAKIGRVAVLKDCRGEGLGVAVMNAAMTAARRMGLAPLVLDAQVQVIPFYERLGFVAEGPVFDDAGIPHRRMTRPS